MATFNQVTLVGYLGQDPELKKTEKGIEYVNVSIATDESYKNEKGDKIEKTEWHNLTCFKGLAEIISKFCKKGSLIFVSGKLQTDKYTDEKTKETRYYTKVLVRNIQLLDRKKDDRNVPPPPSDDGLISDDLPY